MNSLIDMELIRSNEPDFSFGSTGAYVCRTITGYRAIESRAAARFECEAMSGAGYSGPEAKGGVRIRTARGVLEVFRP